MLCSRRILVSLSQLSADNVLPRLAECALAVRFPTACSLVSSASRRSIHVPSCILRAKSKSSQAWIQRHINDPYVKKSRYESYRARSAYKLLEIDERFGILKPGMVAIDCGAAPGAWTQVLVKKTNSAHEDKSQPCGTVIAVDINHIFPVEGATVLGELDFTLATTQTKILSLLKDKKADIVLSDMAPNATGIRSVDHDMITILAYSALNFSLEVLNVGGIFLCKLWDGNRTNQLLDDMKRFFKTAKTVKPPASRSDSAELYLLGKDFVGAAKQA